jgi:chromate reductase, NAD(P)H dehydrogenase (quinone)
MAKILGVSGSLRKDSWNTKLLRVAGQLLPPGVELELYENLKAVPPYDEDDDRGSAPAAAADFRNAIADADGVLFATPEYNSSVPGQLKNAIDWASRPLATNVLRNKPVAVVGASTGQFGALWAQQDLKRILGIAGARVVGTEIPVSRADERFGQDGRLLDGEIFEQLRLHLTTLAAEAVTADERVAA